MKRPGIRRARTLGRPGRGSPGRRGRKPPRRKRRRRGWCGTRCGSTTTAFRTSSGWSAAGWGCAPPAAASSSGWAASGSGTAPRRPAASRTSAWWPSSRTRSPPSRSGSSHRTGSPAAPVPNLSERQSRRQVSPFRPRRDPLWLGSLGYTSTIHEIAYSVLFIRDWQRHTIADRLPLCASSLLIRFIVQWILHHPFVSLHMDRNSDLISP